MRRSVRSAALCLLASCSGSPTPASAPPPVDWGWPFAAADVGTSRFQITGLLRTPPASPETNATFQVQGQIEDAGGALMADFGARLRVVGDDGAERVVAFGNVTAATRQVAWHGLDLGAQPRRIATLDVEARLVNVSAWRTETVVLERAGDERRVVLPPWEFGVSADAESVHVWAAGTERARETVTGLEGVLTHRWAADEVTIVDAASRAPTMGSGVGTGGTTSTSHLLFAGADGVVAPPTFPVTVTVRVPETWTVTPVRYRFSDLDLSAVPTR